MRILFMTRFQSKALRNKIVIACKKRGHDVEIISPADVAFVCDGRKNPITYKGNPFPKADAIFPYWKRKDSYMWDVLKFLEGEGSVIVNGPSSISPDKRMIALTLARNEVAHPKTWSVNTQQTLVRALDDIQAPYVFKEAYSSRGTKVFKVDTKEEAFTIASVLIDDARDFVIQEMIQPEGQDIRAFVVGNKVIAAMERTAVKGEFRANICQGATATTTNLTIEEELMVLKVSNLFGCLMSGVDFMRTKQGTVCLEINKKPGLEGIEEASGMDIAPLIVEELELLIKNKTKVA